MCYDFLNSIYIRLHSSPGLLLSLTLAVNVKERRSPGDEVVGLIPSLYFLKTLVMEVNSTLLFFSDISVGCGYHRYQAVTTVFTK